MLHGNSDLSWGSFEVRDMYKKRWRYSQQSILEETEWLFLLQKRVQWQNVVDNLKVGDLVLICDEASPRGLWPLGRVVEVKLGRDNLFRSARVKPASSELVIKSIIKLISLEGPSVWDR